MRDGLGDGRGPRRGLFAEQQYASCSKLKTGTPTFLCAGHTASCSERWVS